jgi:hypothetical protein
MSNSESLDNSFNKVSYNIIKKYHNDSTSCCFIRRNKTDRSIEKVIDWVYSYADLDNSLKELLLIRYITIIKKVEQKYKKYSRCYTYSTLFTSIASLMVTAFISINNLSTNTPETSFGLWWSSWGLSLGITLVNTIGSFFKWDRKYLLLFKVFAKLEQEIWMYLELVGPYANNTKNIGGHKEKLNIFLTRLETIHKGVNETIIDIEENEDKDDKNKQIIPTQKDNKGELSVAPNNGLSESYALQSPGPSPPFLNTKLSMLPRRNMFDTENPNVGYNGPLSFGKQASFESNASDKNDVFINKNDEINDKKILFNEKDDDLSRESKESTPPKYSIDTPPKNIDIDSENNNIKKMDSNQSLSQYFKEGNDDEINHFTDHA